MPEVAPRVEPEMPGGGVVAPFDAVASVEDDDALRKGFGGAAEPTDSLGEPLAILRGGALVPMQGEQHFVPPAARLGYFARERPREPARQPRELVGVIAEGGAKEEREDRPAPGRAQGEACSERDDRGKEERCGDAGVDAAHEEPIIH